jgi:hypothetical protein
MPFPAVHFDASNVFGLIWALALLAAICAVLVSGYWDEVFYTVLVFIAVSFLIFMQFVSNSRVQLTYHHLYTHHTLSLEADTHITSEQEVSSRTHRFLN